MSPPVPCPSAPSTVVTVAFLPRHGPGHRWPPHRVNYRANVDAMRQLGVSALLGPFAAGSLRADLRAGRARGGRPVRRPHLGPGRDLPRRVRRRTGAPQPSRPVRPERPRRPPRRGHGHRHRGPRRRHCRGRERPTVLDPRRVALVPGPGLGPRQHDPTPRGGARRRSRASPMPVSPSSPTTTPAWRTTRPSPPSPRRRSSPPSTAPSASSAISFSPRWHDQRTPSIVLIPRRRERAPGPEPVGQTSPAGCRAVP